MSPEIKQERWDDLNIPKFPYDQIQLFCILRLKRISYLLETNTVYADWEGKLLDRARMSIYMDCIQQGIKYQADELLKLNKASSQEQK